MNNSYCSAAALVTFLNFFKLDDFEVADHGKSMSSWYF